MNLPLSRVVRLGVLAALMALVVAVAAGPTAAVPTGFGTPGNPLAGGTLGVYTGSADGVYPAWQAATGKDKALLAKVALVSRVRWFGGWLSPAQASEQIQSYIATTQAGDPSVIVPMAVFRLWPKGESHLRQHLSAQWQAAYKAWVAAAAAAIGDARVALVLEPDLPVSLKGWKPAVRLRLAAYAARQFGALPNTSTYLDVGDSDWLSVPQAVTVLQRAGATYVRGFALGATHYSSTTADIRYGTGLVAALAKVGIRNRHFVIDTADNGRPFTYGQYVHAHPHGDFDNAQACATPTQKHCVTLGIPATTDVANPRWRLAAADRVAALRHVDAYLWFGRPWLYRQASPFLLRRTLQVAATTPY